MLYICMYCMYVDVAAAQAGDSYIYVCYVLKCTRTIHESSRGDLLLHVLYNTNIKIHRLYNNSN